MSGEREAADLAAIKHREQMVRDAIRRGEPSVAVTGQFTSQQIGLRAVWADEWGRLWRDDGDRLTRIYSPRVR